MSYHKDADAVAEDIRELRVLGLSYPAIAGAIFHFTGVGLTENQVRYKCDELGFAPNSNMARSRVSA